MLCAYATRMGGSGKSGVNFALVVDGVFLLWRVKLLSGLSGLVLLGVSAGIASWVALTSLPNFAP